MIVKHGILALLTQGPAYGLQLRTELMSRTRRAPAINVGQVYSTLERALGAGLVTQDSHTDDGLPLYRLTREGEREARRWLAEPEFAPASAFDDMVCQVLLARSLPGVDATVLARGYRAHWEAEAEPGEAEPGPGDSSPEDRIARDRRAAATALAAAALAWLESVEREPADGWPLARIRPARGRPRTDGAGLSAR